MNGLIAYDSSSDEEGVQSVVKVGKVGITLEPDVNCTAQTPAHGTGQPLAASKADTTKNTRGALLGPTMPDDVIHSYEEQSEQDMLRRLTRTTHPIAAIPDSPPGSPDPAANARIERFLELKARGVHFNEDLASKSNFRNPGLLSNMMKRAGIDENEQYATSLPTAMWEPSIFPEWSYKEGLLKIQQELRERSEAAKKVRSAGGKRMIEFASASDPGGCSRHSTPNQQNKRRRP